MPKTPEIKIPIWIRVGDGAEHLVGKVHVSTVTQAYLSFSSMLRDIADQIDEQTLQDEEE